MSYIGRNTDKISNIEILDNITFDGSSSYSITKSSVAFTPNSAQSLLISIDGVVQATNFSVSSSTIDFGVAVPSTSTCDFFLHYGTGVAFTPSDGTVTEAKIGSGAVTSAKLADSSVSLAKLTATGTKDATTFLRGDNTFATAGGDNTPAFQTRLTSNQSVSSSTQTTVAFNVVTGSKAFDSDSAFNTTTYKFVVPSGEGGKYFITSTLRLNESIPSDRCAVDIEVNGSSAGVTGEIQGAHQFFTVTANAIFILNASDTVEVKFFQDSGVSKTIRSDASIFAGYKLIGV